MSPPHAFKQSLVFHCRPQDIFDVLTKAQLLQSFTRSKCESEPKAGGSFSIFGGSIHGFYDEFVAAEKLVMRWRMKEW